MNNYVSIIPRYLHTSAAAPTEMMTSERIIPLFIEFISNLMHYGSCEKSEQFRGERSDNALRWVLHMNGGISRRSPELQQVYAKQQTAGMGTLSVHPL